MNHSELQDRATQLWNCGITHIDDHNRAAWVRAVTALGDKWLLAKQVERITPQSEHSLVHVVGLTH